MPSGPSVPSGPPGPEGATAPGSLPGPGDATGPGSLTGPGDATGSAVDAGPRRGWALGFTVLLVVAAAVALTAAGRGGSRTDAARAPSPALVIGEPVPGFTATTVDGRPVSLSAIRGRPVWLAFGGTWCAPCRAEAHDIQAAHAAAGPDGVVVIAVYPAEDASTVRGFSRRLGLQYAQVADPDRRLAVRFGVSGTPTHYFIDRSGTLRGIRSGALSPGRIAVELAQIDG